jgi:membrane protease YdiL (CAAX protease family)
VLATAVSSVVFAAIHPQGWTFIPVLGALAVAFCIAREWTGSINPAIVAHAINNFAMVMINVVLMR